MEADILFIDGLMPLDVETSYLGYLYTIAPVLEQHGYVYKILNLGMMADYSINCLISELKRIDFKAIGMTTNASNIQYVHKVCKAIKMTFPKSFIILGGPEVTYSDFETLQHCPCDVIIRKTGEFKIVKILDCITGKGQTMDNIGGITYKNSEGTIIRNEDDNDYDINTIPVPKYELLTKDQYWIKPRGSNKISVNNYLKLAKNAQSVYILTGLGCPYRCNFCVEGITKHKKTYFMSPEKVRKNFEHYLKTYKRRYVGIADDTFTSSFKRVNDLCEVFKNLQKKYFFTWYAEGRVDVLSKHPELIGIMYDAGLRRLQIGIESGNQKVLDAYSKLITVEQIMTVLEEAAKYPKLEVCGNVIVGNPFETSEDFKKSVDNLKKMYIASGKKLTISSSYLTPYHGTPIRNEPERFGIEIIVDNFETSPYNGMNDITCKPINLGKQEVVDLKDYVDKQIFSWYNEYMFNLNKNEIWERIHSITTNFTPFGFTFGKLQSFKSYIHYVSNNLVVSGRQIRSQDFDKVYPLKMWDIDYKDNQYTYISLSGEKIVMNKYKSELWELANGNNSLENIQRYILKNYNVSSSEIKEFYDNLEDRLGIIYKKYDLKKSK
ncbi:MAG: radical SAM protein [Bacteroidia bacterium]|nr:radical SAM protein [Bacteroidia bacterium]